jgi:hypothetical protein
MVTTIDKLLLKIEADASRANSGIDAFEKKINLAKRRMELFDRVSKAGLKRSATLTNKAANQIARFERQQEKLNDTIQSMKGPLLGAGLSFLFTGMAIKRFFQTALFALFDTFSMVMGQNNLTIDRINELKAKWELFKFSLFDALANSGVFDIWLDRFEKIIDWFNDLDEASKVKLTDFIIKAFLAGTALMVLGQTMLGLLGVFSAISLVIKLFKLLRFSILLIPKALKLISVAVKFLFANPILLSIALIIGSFALLVNKTGSVKNAFKVLGFFILQIFAGIGDLILMNVLIPLKAIIAVINAVRRLQGKELIKQPELFGLSQDVFRRANELKLAIEQQERADAFAETRRSNEQPTKTSNVNNIEVNITGETGELNEDVLAEKINEVIQRNQNFFNGSPQS